MFVHTQRPPGVWHDNSSWTDYHLGEISKVEKILNMEEDVIIPAVRSFSTFTGSCTFWFISCQIPHISGAGFNGSLAAGSLWAQAPVQIECVC